MTSPRRIEVDLPAILADLYLGGTPDYRDDLVQQVARVRQRPAWTFPERWLPMDFATKAVPGAPRVQWRIVAVLALLAALLVGMLVFYAGSQRPLPAPFGRAANGSIVFTADGDIVAADPVTGEVRQIVTGPEADDSPVFSGDGTMLAFHRLVGDGLGQLVVANADGTGLVPVIADPTHLLTSWAFSHDSRTLLVSAVVDGTPQVLLVGSDGQSAPRVLDVPLPTDVDQVEMAGFRPTDPTEILVVAKSPGSPNRGLVAIDTDTDEMRTILAPDPVADVFGAAWSPDGAWITYGRFVPADTVTARSHIIAPDGTGDRRVDASPDTDFDGLKGWSNDSTRFVIERGSNDGDSRHVIVTLDRTSAPIEIDCSGGGPARCPDGWLWSPDDTTLLGFINEEGDGLDRHVLADPLTGKVRPAPWTATGDPTWQRRAP